jgi:putative transposase
MVLMGLQAIHPKRKISVADPGHKRYPYLLRGFQIVHPCQVWSSDITYLPMRGGFMVGFVKRKGALPHFS